MVIDRVGNSLEYVWEAGWMGLEVLMVAMCWEMKGGGGWWG